MKLIQSVQHRPVSLAGFSVTIPAGTTVYPVLQKDGTPLVREGWIYVSAVSPQNRISDDIFDTRLENVEG